MNLVKLFGSIHYRKCPIGLYKNLLNVKNLALQSKSYSNEPKFNFTVSKFNDIHIRSNDVDKIIKQIDSNDEAFEKILISKNFYINFRKIFKKYFFIKKNR